MSKLFGKQVLFIAPQYFGYEIDIAEEMKREGAEVDFLPDRPFLSPFLRGLIRFRRELVLPLMDHYFLNAIEKFGRHHYDIIFVVVGEGLSTRTLTALRTSFPNANLVLYMWDALRNRRLLDKNLSLFDTCHTFDSSDAKSYGMNFRPLFFSPGFEQEVALDFKYDISFVGTAHSDRCRIVSNVKAALPNKTTCYWYLYLQAPWVFYGHKLVNQSFRNESIKNFNFEALSKPVVQSIFFKSRAILDIEHPNQSGLTMRTFETIGANKKLITTNNRIVEYDFFNHDNIFVIDRKNVSDKIDNFIRGPYIPLTSSLYMKYSLAGWLNDVIP